MRPAPAALALLLLAPALAGCLAESEWSLEVTGLRTLLDRGLTGRGVRVAIIDTGIDPSHPEFGGRQVLWRDFVNGRGQPYDDSEVGHGTHVAGLLISKGDLMQGLFNGVRIRGAAQGVSLIVAKAVAGTGDGRDEDVAAAVDFAVREGSADVIIMSLGGRGLLLVGTATENAVRRAADRGVVVVAAAGNKEDGRQEGDDVASPASVEAAIAVGAIDRAKRIASFSYRGNNDGNLPLPVDDRRDPHKKPELVAPGVQILSTARDQRYAIADGTSQAAPFVGAAVALLLEAKPEYKQGGARGGSASSVAAIKLALAQGAEKVGPLAGRTGLAHDDLYGYGLLRADLALQRL